MDQIEVRKEYYGGDKKDLLVEESEYKNNKRNGKTKMYIRCGYKHPELNTSENEFNYYLYKEINYKDNMLDGEYIEWYYKPYPSDFWINKVKELIKLYNIDIDENKADKLLNYSIYKNGKQNGICISADIALKLLLVYEYKDGIMLNDDKIMSWNKNGEFKYLSFK